MSKSNRTKPDTSLPIEVGYPDAFAEFDGKCTDESRRRFLKAAGFGFFGAMMFGCSPAPEEKALPLLEQPEGMLAGRSELYATTCAGCSAGCGILAKSRDGRPIKLEGNPDHPLSRGGLCAVGQASLLGLYDKERLSSPLRANQPTNWDHVDAEMSVQIRRLQERSGRVRYLSAPITSPTKRAAIDSFLGSFSNAKLVIYDPASGSAILDAHESTHGSRVVPRYFFERSKMTVAFDADFLGRWISPVEFTAAHSQRRRGDNPNSFCEHIQFESRMSVTGAKADRRYRISPGELNLVLTHLAARISDHAGVSFDVAGIEACPVEASTMDAIASRVVASTRWQLGHLWC